MLCELNLVIFWIYCFLSFLHIICSFFLLCPSVSCSPSTVSHQVQPPSFILCPLHYPNICFCYKQTNKRGHPPSKMTNYSMFQKSMDKEPRGYSKLQEKKSRFTFSLVFLTQTRCLSFSCMATDCKRKWKG